LRQRLAHELEFVTDDSVDLVIINSVVQYFPSTDYLLQVLEQAVAGGGTWREYFHRRRAQPSIIARLSHLSSTAQSPPEMAIEELRQRIRKAQLAEEELVG